MTELALCWQLLKVHPCLCWLCLQGICPSIKFHINIIASFICELLPRSLQVFFGSSLDSLADLFRGRVHNVGFAVYNIAVLLLGVVLVVVTVIYSKRLLRKLEAEELKREAAAEAAAAADEERGLDAEGQMEDSFAANVRVKEVAKDRELDTYSTQVERKLAVGPTVKPAGSEGSGDLEILVDDSKNNAGTAATVADGGNSALFNRSGSSCSSMIPAGHLVGSAAELGSSSSSSIMSVMDRTLTREDSKLSS